MILPSNLPSPAGYSFGSYTSAAVDDHPSDPLKRTTSIPEQQQHHDAQGDAASTESSSISPSLASPTTSLLFKGSDGGHRSLSGLLLNRDSNTNHNNSSSNNSRGLSSNHHHHHHVDSTTGATAVPAASAAAAASAASAGLGSTTYLRSSPSLAPTIGATADGASAASSSLSVALCRSLVLKYIYLTYLFLAHYLVVVPTTAFQIYILRRTPGTKGFSAASSSSPYRDEQGRDVDEHGHVLDSAVGEQFLQQYTLDNHRRGSRSQAYGANYTTASTTTLTSTNHSHHQIGVSSSNNSNNGSGGTTMLRRSSRFKSKSDLEEIAQQSAATITASGTLAGTSMALLRKSSADSGTGLSSDPGTGSLASGGVGGGGGYGTDSSMAEDAGSGRGHLRLRQRLTGRPSSGLGTPGSGSGGRHGLSKTKTLVLDLDETLIHSTSRGSRSQGYMVEVLVDRHACLYYVYKRPHVDYFLKKVSEWYKLVIFTASMSEYADPVIDWLDQNRTLFDQRYFRQACQYRNGSYLKDLSIVESDLSSVCLLDNSPLSYSLNKENGIPIDSWINDPDDEALLDLLPFLDALRFTEDVRSVLSLRTV